MNPCHARSTSYGTTAVSMKSRKYLACRCALEGGSIHISLMKHELIWVTSAPVDKEALTPGLGSSWRNVNR